MAWHVRVMYHTHLPTWVGLKHEILVVVLLVLISVKVDAVKVELTMRKLVAGKGTQDEIRAVSLVRRYGKWTQFSRLSLLFAYFNRFS